MAPPATTYMTRQIFTIKSVLHVHFDKMTVANAAFAHRVFQLRFEADQSLLFPPHCSTNQAGRRYIFPMVETQICYKGHESQMVERECIQQQQQQYTIHTVFYISCKQTGLFFDANK